MLPQRFQTSRQELWVSWLAQLVTRVGEPGDGLASELGGGEAGEMEGGAMEGGEMEVNAMEGGAMEVREQRRRTAAVGGRLAESEAGLGQEGGDGGLLLPLDGRESGRWEQVRRW